MKKEISLKDINFKNIKESPIFFAVVIGLFTVLVLAFSVYLINNIFSLKTQMTEVKKKYEENCQQVIALQVIQAKYGQLVKEKDALDRMLPDVGDPEEYTYTMMQELYDTADKYHLTVSSLEKPIVSASYTTEITAQLTVNGTYSNITAFIEYYAGLEPIHRIEKFDLADHTDSELKQAVITIVALAKSN